MNTQLIKYSNNKKEEENQKLLKITMKFLAVDRTKRIWSQNCILLRSLPGIVISYLYLRVDQPRNWLYSNKNEEENQKLLKIHYEIPSCCVD